MNVPDPLFNKISSLLLVIQSSCKACYFRDSARCRECFAKPAQALHREMAQSCGPPRPCGITLGRPERVLLRHILANPGGTCDISRASIPGLEAYEKRRAIDRLLEKRLITVSGGTGANGRPRTLVSANPGFLGQIRDALSAQGN